PAELLAELHPSHPEPIEGEGLGIPEDRPGARPEPQRHHDPGGAGASAADASDRNPPGGIHAVLRVVPVPAQEPSVELGGPLLLRSHRGKDRVIERVARKPDVDLALGPGRPAEEGGVVDPAAESVFRPREGVTDEEAGEEGSRDREAEAGGGPPGLPIAGGEGEEAVP